MQPAAATGRETILAGQKDILPALARNQYEANTGGTATKKDYHSFWGLVKQLILIILWTD
jgi:hypothetical protein